MAERSRSKRPPAPPPRSSSPSWRLDLAALVLFLAGLAVTMSVLSHDPADPPTPTVYPAHNQPHNLLGPLGAELAHALIGALGIAVQAFLASWFVLVVLLLLRRGLLRWSLRFLGWILLIPSLAVLADQLSWAARDDWLGATAPAGPGGSIGAWLSLCLERSLPALVQVGVLASALLISLLLVADTLCWRTARLSWRCLRLACGWLWLLLTTSEPRSRTAPDVAPSPEKKTATPPILSEAEEEPESPPADPAPTPEPVESARAIPIRYHDKLDAATPVTGRKAAKAPPVERAAPFELPPLTLLGDPETLDHSGQDQLLRERATLLEKTFADFGLKVQVVGINTGPVITQYEIALDTGLRVHKVTRLGDDVALNLRVPSVRMVAPIPGKNTVGIEMPNERRARVRLKEVVIAAGKKGTPRLPLFLGKDSEGRPLVPDLADMPHLLIAGTTGTGKSVCMNALILSLLLTRRPDEVRMIMIDPKQTELEPYSKIPHLMHPVVTDMKKAEAILAWAVDKMEERYDLLRRARVKNIVGFNDMSREEVLRRIKPEDEQERSQIPEHMPYIVIFIDEMADLILMMKKEVEGHIIRLAQKARAAGIHLVVATQKPTVDVITGLIKSNLPARICFKVASKSDSRVVLDEMGADKLLGKGDLLFLPPGTSTLVRGQGTYADEDEITRVVEHLECDEPCYAEELMQLSVAGRDGNFLDKLRERDELYEAAIEIVIREQRGSVSLLQRALGIGYGRAARLIDFMAEDGIVGPYNGSNAREVSYNAEQWDQLKSTATASR